MYIVDSKNVYNLSGNFNSNDIANYSLGDSIDDNDGNEEVTGQNSSIIETASRLEQKDKALKDKRDISGDELKKLNSYLVGPINQTDPIVWHDPTFKAPIIISQLSEDKKDKSVTNNSASQKVEAIMYPIIKINQIVVEPQDILNFSLSSTEFLPSVSLRIVDKNNNMLNSNTAGINNELVIVITAPLNGVYKKIKLPFYIESLSRSKTNDNVNIYATFKLNKLHEFHNEEMNFPNKFEFPECSKCKQNKATLANTWELLHYIALNCELGFASTEKCKDIADRRPRLLKGNYIDIIEKSLSCGGKDENSIFNAWIDLYGYLTMVNLPYIFNSNIKPNNLGIYAIKGNHDTTVSDPTKTEKSLMVIRTIFNSSNLSDLENNLQIKNFKIETDTELFNSGLLNTYRTFSPIGSGKNGNNSITEEQIQIIENSLEGNYIEEYSSSTEVFSGIEMLSDAPILSQKEKVNAYNNKLRIKKMIVEMKNINLGLVRGQLVNVTILNNDAKTKSKIINSPDAIHKEDDKIQPNREISNEDLLNSNNSINDIVTGDVELPNFGLSGLYYIDGVEYNYKYGNNAHISQKLYLLKKGAWGNYTNSKSVTKIDMQK